MLSTTELVHPTNLPIKPPTSTPSFQTAEPSAQIPAVEPVDTPVIPCSPNRDERPALARNPDGAAFDELIQRQRDTCLRRALLIMRNRSDAEDAVQNAFRKAFQHREQFQGTGTFAA